MTCGMCLGDGGVCCDLHYSFTLSKDKLICNSFFRFRVLQTEKLKSQRSLNFSSMFDMFEYFFLTGTTSELPRML